MTGKFILASAAALAFASPQSAAAASEWPLVPGDFVEMSSITVDDGHMLDYAKHLAGLWRDSQDYAKQQGWISNYQVWINEYPRAGEPDVYLVVWFPGFADPAEALKREEAYKAHMKMTTAQMQEASGQRAEYRKLAGSMLFKNYTWAK